MYKILNSNGKVISKCSYMPDIDDLKSRNEIVEIDDGEEIYVENEPDDSQSFLEYKMIYDKMFKDAQKALQESGVEFKAMKDYYKKPFGA